MSREVASKAVPLVAAAADIAELRQRLRQLHFQTQLTQGRLKQQSDETGALAARMAELRQRRRNLGSLRSVRPRPLRPASKRRTALSCWGAQGAVCHGGHQDHACACASPVELCGFAESVLLWRVRTTQARPSVSLQGLSLVLEAQQTLTAFDSLLSSKAWPEALATVEHAAQLLAEHVALVQRLRCLRSLPQAVQACRTKLKGELLRCMLDGAALSAAAEVTALCALELKVHPLLFPPPAMHVCLCSTTGRQCAFATKAYEQKARNRRCPDSLTSAGQGPAGL